MTRRVAYVLLEFPRYSETFILSELIALREFGLPSRIFCLRSAADGEPHIPSEFADITELISGADQDVALQFGEIPDALAAPAGAFVDTLETSYREMTQGTESDAQSSRAGFWRAACAVRIAASCRRNAIEHLHCHYATDPAEVGALVSQLTAIPCSFTGHAKDIFTQSQEALGSLIRRMKFTVGCSRTGVSFMRMAAPDRVGDIHCVYHGIRLADWSVARKGLADPPLILAIGRLTPKKGFRVLVEAVGLLRRRGLPVQAEIVGDGRERGPIEEDIRRLDLRDSVRLIGRLTQEQIRERFEVASALVLPSVILRSNNQDGLANVVLEAMASGVPVIVSDVPALGEVVTDGETGLVFPRGDAASLAERIELLLHDPRLQASLAAAGKKRVANLDCKTAAETLVSLFHAYE